MDPRATSTLRGTAALPRPGAVAALILTVLLVGSVRVAAAGAPVAGIAAPEIVAAPVAVSAPTAAFVDVPPAVEVPAPAPVPADPAPPVAPVAPEPVPTPTPVSPPTMTAEQRVSAAFHEAVPARWQQILPVWLRIIDGATSYAQYPDVIEVAQRHVDGTWTHLVSVLSHEFGHLIAFSYGTGAFDGAPPEGWPDPGYAYPAESWADCVAQAFTGIVDPSYGMPACPDGSLEWTRSWLDSVPDR